MSCFSYLLTVFMVFFLLEKRPFAFDLKAGPALNFPPPTILSSPPLDQLDSIYKSLQIDQLIDSLKAHHLSPGENLKVGIFDEGFALSQNYSLNKLLELNQIQDSWDFVSNRPLRSDSIPSDFNGTYAHGSQVLSLLASKQVLKSGLTAGLIPNASFFLYRTENSSIEDTSEARSLVNALERAHSKNVQFYNISLGYRYGFDQIPDLSYDQLNGENFFLSKKVSELGAQGRFIFVAMGNEQSGQGLTPTLSSPADANSIFSIGALATNTSPCSFSSFGPSYDLRIKPDLSMPGCPVPVADIRASGTPETWANNSGTSFSSPLALGVVALLSQAFPLAQTSELMQVLKSTSLNSQNPNSQIGFGLIQPLIAWKTLSQKYPLSIISPQIKFKFQIQNGKFYFQDLPNLKFQSFNSQGQIVSFEKQCMQEICSLHFKENTQQIIFLKISQNTQSQVILIYPR